MSDGPNSSPADAPPGDEEETGSVVDFPRERSVDRPSHNLPLELTSFSGREKALAEVKRLLDGDACLVTLCGPGGCGKTRLALAVAREMVEGFEDGVWWVELASLADPKLVPGPVAQALGVREVPESSLSATSAPSFAPTTRASSW